MWGFGCDLGLGCRAFGLGPRAYGLGLTRDSTALKPKLVLRP